MKRFVFRAETVLALRRREDEKAQQSLAFAEQQVRQAEVGLAESEARLQEQITRGAEAAQAPQGLHAAIWYRNWIEKLRREVELRRRLLEQRRLEAHDARARAQEAHRKRRALERLRDRQHATHVVRERLEEQQALDELAGLQFVNRRQGGHREH